MSITFPNGSQIIFIGLDSEEKLLSLQNVSTIWCEESYEIEKNKIEQMNLRMRGQAQNQQLILSWNPISKQSWLFDFTVENPPESSIFHHSTYKDNPFLNAEYIAALDEMAIRNPAKYRIYGLGEWGVDVEGQVITNYRVEEFDAMELAKQGLEHRCGMDIGWRDKSAITATLYDREQHIIYVYDEFYKSGCQASELAQAIKDMGLAKCKIKVDNAEPRMVQFFRNEGINAEGCAKGRDSVRAGYMFLQDNLIIVHPKCKNLIVEFENLCYAKSKLTGEYTEDFNDHTYTHACDSVRYAYSDIYTNKQLKTINKASLGL
jgi:phage terminase large subunit